MMPAGQSRFRPTVIVGGDFASAAVEKWSPEYFTEHWTSKRRLGGLSTRLKTVAGKWKFVYTQRDDEEAPVQSKTPYNPLRFAWDEEAVTLNYTTSEDQETVTHDPLLLPGPTRTATCRRHHDAG